MSEKNIIFSLDKIYIQDASIEVSQDISILHPLKSTNIDTNMNFSIDYETKELDQDLYKTVIIVKSHAECKNKNLIVLEVEQVGIFTIKNIPTQQMELVLNIECPNLVFPYIRETISNLSAKAGFPPIIISAINFAQVYQQKQNKSKDKVEQ